MDLFQSAVDKLKKEASGAMLQAHEEGVEQISQQDLLHLTMKLSKRLKTTEAGWKKAEEELATERAKLGLACRAVERDVLRDPTMNLETLDAETLQSVLEAPDLVGSRDQDFLDTAIKQRDALAARVGDLEAHIETTRARHEEELVFLRHRASKGGEEEERSKRQLAQAQEKIAQMDKEMLEKEAQLRRLRSEMTARDNANAVKTQEIARLSASLRRAEGLSSSIDEARFATLLCLGVEAALSTASRAYLSARLAVLDAQSSIPHNGLLRLEVEDRKHRSEAELARKSALARQIVVEKDGDIQKLQQRCRDLEREAASGGHAHKRIVEIAEQQSQRDGRMSHEARTQKIVNIKLHRLLKRRDAELAELHGRLSKQQRPLSSSSASKARVDLEYVKNVVVHYLSLPSGSSERSSLIPVLATVLHFTDADMKRLAKASDDNNSIALKSHLLQLRRPNSPPLDLEAIDQYRKIIPDEFDA